jgi:hypothetical protein
MASTTPGLNWMAALRLQVIACLSMQENINQAEHLAAAVKALIHLSI